jgi:hypothetical protein
VLERLLFSFHEFEGDLYTCEILSLAVNIRHYWMIFPSLCHRAACSVPVYGKHKAVEARVGVGLVSNSTLPQPETIR